MTTANMKLVIVNVTMEDKLNLPKQKLEEGEFIVPRIVELSKLYEVLRGMSIASYLTSSMRIYISEYAKKVRKMVVYGGYSRCSYIANFRTSSWTPGCRILRWDSTCPTRSERRMYNELKEIQTF